MTLASTTLTDIAANADESDLERVIAAVKARRTALGQVRAAAVQVNAHVELHGLTPKYLNGLTGTVTSITKGKAVVTLDNPSTRRLAAGDQRSRFGLSFATANDMTAVHPVRGVPLQCLKVLGDVSG